MRARKVAAFSAVVVILTGVASAAEDIEGSFAHRDELLQLPVSPGAIVMCHGFNCLYRDEVAFSAKDIAEMTKLMRPGKASAADERVALGKLMAWLDRHAGPQLGTVGHVAQAGAGHAGERGQLDCIDTTHNTTLMLRELQLLGLLVHHRPDEPVSRGGPHTSAVMTDMRTGVRWVVDGWTRGYGEVPDIMPVSRWLVAELPPLPGTTPPAAAAVKPLFQNPDSSAP